MSQYLFNRHFNKMVFYYDEKNWNVKFSFFAGQMLDIMFETTCTTYLQQINILHELDHKEVNNEGVKTQEMGGLNWILKIKVFY